MADDMYEDLEVISEYASLDDRELYDDFLSIVSDVNDARENQRSFTSSQLPEGFDSVKLEGSDFGFLAEKEYEEGKIDIEYRESSDIGFGGADSSRIKIEVEPADYTLRDAWDQLR